MALIKIEDGQNYINDFNSNSNIIAQNWTDELGKKTIKELLEVSQFMNSCISNINMLEASITQVADCFLQECGGSAASGEISDLDTIEKLRQEILMLLNEIIASEGSDSSGRHSSPSGNARDNKKGSSESRPANLVGTMRGGAPVYRPQEDSEEYTQEHVKVKRR